MAELTPKERAVLEEYVRRNLGGEQKPKYAAPADTPDVNIIRDYLPALAPNSPKEALEQVGGTAGLYFGPIGAALAGGGANVIGQLGEQSGMLPSDWSGSYHMPTVPPEGFDINWKEAGTSGAVQGIGALTGKLVGMTGNKIGAQAARTIKPETIAAREYMQQQGGDLIAPQMTRGVGQDVAQNISDVAITSRGTMTKFYKEKQTEPLKRAMKDIVDNLGGGFESEDVAGNQLKEAINKQQRSIKRWFAPQFKAWDKAVGNNDSVKIDKMKTLWDDIIAEQKEGGEASRIATIYKNKFSETEATTFEEAINRQSYLTDIPSEVEKLLPSRDKALLLKMKKAWQDAIYSAADNIAIPITSGSKNSNWMRGQTASEARKSLLELYAQTERPFNKRTIKQIINTEGGVQAFEKALRQKSPSLVADIKEASGGGKKWNNVMASWFKDKLGKEWYDPDTGIMDYDRFIKDIDAMGDSYKVAFAGPQREAIDKLVDTIRIINATAKSGKIGTMWIQLKQASTLSRAVSQIGSGSVIGGLTAPEGEKTEGMTKGAVIAMVAPWALSKILVSPTATSYFTRCMREGKADKIEALASNILRYAGTRGYSALREMQERTEPQEEPTQEY